MIRSSLVYFCEKFLFSAGAGGEDSLVWWSKKIRFTVSIRLKVEIEFTSG